MSQTGNPSVGCHEADISTVSEPTGERDWDHMLWVYYCYVEEFKTLDVPQHTEFTCSDAHVYQLGLWTANLQAQLVGGHLPPHRYEKLLALHTFFFAQRTSAGGTAIAETSEHTGSTSSFQSSSGATGYHPVGTLGANCLNSDAGVDAYGDEDGEGDGDRDTGSPSPSPSPSRPDSTTSGSLNTGARPIEGQTGSAVIPEAIVRAVGGVISPYDSWTAHLEALVRYCRVHGSCNCPARAVATLADGRVTKLGRWVDRQRQSFRRGELDPPRLHLLQVLVAAGLFKWNLQKEPAGRVRRAWPTAEDISGGLCNGRGGDGESMSAAVTVEDEQRWEAGYQALLEYCRVHQHCNVPASFRSGREGSSRRSRIRNDNSSGSGCCSSGGFQTGVTAEDAGAGLGVEVGMDLAGWLQQQRRDKRRGRLSSSRAERLQTLVDAGKLCWSDATVARILDPEKWGRYFNELVRYGERCGHCNVPQAEVVTAANGLPLRLGQWLNKQRNDRQNCALPLERERELEQLVQRGWFRWSVGKGHRVKSGGVVAQALDGNAHGEATGGQEWLTGDSSLR